MIMPEISRVLQAPQDPYGLHQITPVPYHPRQLNGDGPLARLDNPRTDTLECLIHRRQYLQRV